MPTVAPAVVAAVLGKHTTVVARAGTEVDEPHRLMVTVLVVWIPVTSVLTTVVMYCPDANGIADWIVPVDVMVNRLQNRFHQNAATCPQRIARKDIQNCMALP